MYDIIFSKRSLKQIAKLETSLQELVVDAIAYLKIVPRPDGCKKLKGFKDTYRVAVKRHRIIYRIEDDVLTIEIIEVIARKDAYKDK